MTTAIADDLGTTYYETAPAHPGQLTNEAEQEPTAPNQHSGRFPVEVTPDIAQLESEVSRQIRRINATSENPVIYSRGGKMVEVAQDTLDGSYRVSELSVSALRSVLSQHCWFYRQTKQERTPAKLNPADLAGMHERTHTLGLPELRKFTQCPLYDSRGRLHSQPGYNRQVAAHIHYPDDTAPIPRVPEEPERHQAEKAAQWLRTELLSDFLFDSDDGKAGVLGLMLTPMCVDMIRGPRPLIAFDAPEAGSGKTLLAKLALWHVMPDMPLPSASESKAEFEKALTAQARKARPVMAFDNLNIVADSGPFAAAITGYPAWEARQLGVSENLTFPAPDAWVVTGNGLQLSDENARRTLTIRISKHHPSYDQWRHPDIRQWVHANRGKVQAALATMVNSWLAADSPAPSSAALPSFEQWAHVIGGVLEHAGVFGLLRNRSELANPERQSWARFGDVLLELQQEGYLPANGATASQIITATNKAYQDNALDELPEQVDLWSRATDLGRALTKRRGSALNQETGLYLIAEQGRANQKLYRAEYIERG